MAYNKDHFIISRNLMSIFDKSLTDLLNMDIDYLECWLRTYDEAVLTQQDFWQCQSEAAKIFFIPKHQQQQSQQTQSKISSSANHTGDYVLTSNSSTESSYSIPLSFTDTVDTDTLACTYRHRGILCISTPPFSTSP